MSGTVLWRTSSFSHLVSHVPRRPRRPRSDNREQYAKRLEQIRTEIAQKIGTHNMRMAFLSCDSDKSGFVDRQELWVLLQGMGWTVSTEGIQTLLNVCDPHRTGRVSYQDFVAAIQGGDLQRTGRTEYTQRFNTPPEYAYGDISGVPISDTTGPPPMKQTARRRREDLHSPKPEMRVEVNWSGVAAGRRLALSRCLGSTRAA